MSGFKRRGVDGQFDVVGPSSSEGLAGERRADFCLQEKGEEIKETKAWMTKMIPQKSVFRRWFLFEIT